MVEYAQTAGFHQFVVEVETAPDSGQYRKICGITTRGTQRTANMANTEQPPCDDEAAPNLVRRRVQSLDQTISGSGVWAAQSHEFMLQWWRSSQPKNVRLQHVNAAPGDTEYESGPAYLTQLSGEVQRGQDMTATIAIEFDGLPSLTPKG